MEIIGKGEKTTVEILRDLLDNSHYYIATQVPFKTLLSHEFYEDGLSERQQKESVDIVVYNGFQPLCIRVQGKDHTGILKSQRDLVQQKMLEWSGNIVVDLWFHDCTDLFKEKLNDNSIKEVVDALKWANYL